MRVRSLPQIAVVFTLTAFLCSAVANAQNKGLGINKAVDNPSPAPGNPVEFTITVRNDASNNFRKLK